LDPKYKLDWYKATGWPSDWIKLCEEKMSEEWTMYKSSHSDSQPSQEFAVEPDHFLGKLYLTQMSHALSAQHGDELQRYLNENIACAQIFKEKGSLGWWAVSNLHLLC